MLIWLSIPQKLIDSLVIGQKNGMQARIQEIFDHDGQMRRF